MLTLVPMIFAKMLIDSIPKWKKKKDAREWEKWEDLEDIRKDMGVERSVEKIRKKPKPLKARNKHRH